MQVFNTFFKILKKQINSIIIYATIFIGITIVISLTSFQDNTKQFEAKRVPVMIHNLDGTNTLLEGFFSYLSDYVTFVPPEDTETARKDALFYGIAQYILTIPEGFTEAFLAGEEITMHKQIIPDAVGAIMLDSTINNYFNTARLYLKYNPGQNMTTLVESLRHNLDQETEVTIDVTQENRMSGYAFDMYYFNYLSYVILSCFIIGVSTVMVAFHGSDIRRRNYASPITMRSINFQLIFANFIFLIIYLMVFLAVGFILNPFRSFTTNTLLHWGNAFIFAITVLSISYLIGITMKNKRSVSAVSTIFSLAFSFISGVFVPQEMLSEPVLRIASFTPTYWYVKGNNAIANLPRSNYSNFHNVLGYMTIQLGFAVAIISIALVIGKRKSQQA